MLQASRLRWVGGLAIVTLLGTGGKVVAQGVPNPYRPVDGGVGGIETPRWAKFPDGRQMGAVGKVTIDNDGDHIWAVVRCDAAGPGRFGNECVDSDLDPVLKFDQEGHLVESFGGGMFIWPHGIDVDPDGNVWVTDGVGDARIPDGDKRGHQVIKFSPTGEVLMTLGTPGVAGNDSYSFTSPADVAVADNGDIFIADGHATEGNNRVVKYSKEGTFIKAWGQTGYGPGEFRTLHAIAIDSQGRVFVGDRSNNRIQIFDQEGNFLALWTQFGRPSGIFFDEHDQIFVADSESDNVQNPGWPLGIWIGDARTGWKTGFVPFPWGMPGVIPGNGAEFVAVDRHGNMYGGEPRPQKLQKYVRVRP